jgi:hypothetical protein
MNEKFEDMQPWQQLTRIIDSWINPFVGFCTIEDAPDGSGDGILTFPDGFCEKVGWEEGDTINIEAPGDGTLVLTKKQH